jgi:hypothetical protein
MKQIITLLNAVAAMPYGALLAVVILSAFALSAYAIYAVVTVTRTRSRQ